MIPRFPVLFLLCFLFHAVRGATQKSKVEDTADTIKYSCKGGGWEDPTCSGCMVVPDVQQASGGTWHACTYNPGDPLMYFELPFRGTGIEVYAILANTVSGNPTTDTLASFFLDDEVDGDPFYHAHDSSSDFEYDYRIYSTTGLSQSKHTLRVEVPQSDQMSSWLAFDYAIVRCSFESEETSTQTSSSLSPSSSNSDHSSGSSSSSSSNQKTWVPIVGAILGAVCGAIVAAILRVWFNKWCKSRRY
ncbi:hypothetical protein DL96DRAFT_1678277 [Flagelloscypha sp. PMI_526]|nr:hypothetical protein DL96DRAFT_1678277 [Flagelloscypha sp. PMI_526]